MAITKRKSPGSTGTARRYIRTRITTWAATPSSTAPRSSECGKNFLVVGHEGFGQVEAVGPKVSFLRPGDFAVATVRRPGTSLYDAIGLQDMTTDNVYFERGINLVP